MPPKQRYESDDSQDSDSCDAKGAKRMKYEKGSEEYVKRRERNNIAVKKSREKTRQKAKETTEQVKKLQAENEGLVQKVSILSKELSVLKDLFLAHAQSSYAGDQQDLPTDHGYSKIKVETK